MIYRIIEKMLRKIDKKTFWLTAFIILIAALPRAIELINHNYLFGYDQGLFFEAVKKIVVNHKLTLIGAEVGGAGGFFQGPGWYYLLSIPFFLTGGDPYGAMVLMFLLGMLTVLLSFKLTETMFDKKTALFIAFLVAISPGIIAQSRFIWPPFVTPPLTVLFLFFLFKTFQKKQEYFILATFTAGLMSHFEIATAGIVMLQTIALSLLLLVKRFISFRTLVISASSFLLTQLPLIVFDLRHNFIIFKGVFRLVGFQINSPEKANVESILFNHFEVMKNNFFSAFQLGSLLWAILLTIIFIGIISYVKDETKSNAQKLFVSYLFISPATFFLISLLYRLPIWEWWLLHLQIFYCFMLGIIFSFFWDKVFGRVTVAIVILIFLLFYVNNLIHFYKNDLFDFGGTHKIRGKIQAIDYIYNDAKGESFNLLVFTPPVYTYAYDYLLWWHGKRNYKYLPTKEKKGTLYLLIEPDSHKPWSYKGWLETVIKSGKIVWEKKLDSGFIIQKRMERS